MAALTASLERANITSSTDQSISASDLARDTALTNNHDEAVATVNIDDTPIPFNFVEHHAPVDIDSVTLVRLVAATINESSTTNVPSDNTIPSKREWFAARGRDTSCNPAPEKLESFGRSGLSLTNAGWGSENYLLTVDFSLRDENPAPIVSEDKQTRRLLPPVGDDIAKVGGKKAPWDILFTEGFEECKNDEGCRAFAPIFITLIIMMVCISGYSCYNNDRKDRIVTAQEEQNNS
jgi:hypothetical protein